MKQMTASRPATLLINEYREVDAAGAVLGVEAEGEVRAAINWVSVGPEGGEYQVGTIPVRAASPLDSTIDGHQALMRHIEDMLLEAYRDLPEVEDVASSSVFPVPEQTYIDEWGEEHVIPKHLRVSGYTTWNRRLSADVWGEPPQTKDALRWLHDVLLGPNPPAKPEVNQVVGF